MAEFDRFSVEGGARLTGRVRVSGSKNAALPILAATLMTDEPCVVEGVPDLHDVRTMVETLRSLGVEVEHTGTTVRTRVVNEDLCTAHYDLVSRMRAGFCVLGPLIAKRGRGKVSLPGGCKIGARPVELHRKGLVALGAEVPVRHGYVEGEADRLHGAEIFLGGAFGSSVLGTANVLTAATLADGVTVIEGAALEPEIEDLARFLVCMGARIQGIGTHRLEIHGVERLDGTTYRIIPDRIEAGTLMAAAAITRGDVELENICLDHLVAVVDYLRALGVSVEKTESGLGCRVTAPERLGPCDLNTHPYPGIPTDMQAQLMAVLCTVDGTSAVNEKVFPDRFIHVGEFNRMGARISKEGAVAIVDGGHRLSGAPVEAPDLRAAAALVLAGLVAEGVTEVSRIDHLDRGYAKFEEKLGALGARIQRVGA